MIVVSDTTPLISLLKINRIDLLEKLFGDVLIPQAVFDELTVDERFRLEADEIRQKKFIVVKPVNNPESASILKRAAGLDQGESEAIVLSDELKADLLLMDEAKGRNVSAQMGLRIMGTIGLGDTPTLTMARSISTVSVAPGMGTGLRRPEASGSPNSIFCKITCLTRPCSSARYSIGLCKVRNSIPSSLACFTSSRRAGISSSERR